MNGINRIRIAELKKLLFYFCSASNIVLCHSESIFNSEAYLKRTKLMFNEFYTQL